VIELDRLWRHDAFSRDGRQELRQSSLPPRHLEPALTAIVQSPGPRKELGSGN
jgi:hypothetical protein